MTREVTRNGHIIRLEDIVPNKDCIHVDSCKYKHRNCHRNVCYARQTREQYQRYIEVNK
jgi:hypothetical protein